MTAGYKPTDEDGLAEAWGEADRAALTHSQAPAVPSGWKLVPMEPTPEMVHAVRFAGDPERPAMGARIIEGETAFPFVGADVALRMCRAMLTAAPTPPAQTTPEPVGGPWGWAIEDKHGVAQAIRPARKEFFGCVQSTEPFTAEDIAKMDREWVGIAPHRIVTLHTRPAEQPAVPEDVARDAERYRWLRDMASQDWLHRNHNYQNLRGAAFDAAIDAARAAGGA